MSTHVRGSSYGFSPAANVQGWVEVSERGVGALFGFALLGMMVWGFGYATVKAAVAALSALAEPALANVLSADSAALLWAVADGLALGLFILLLRWLWQARDRANYRLQAKAKSSQTATAATTLAAALTAGLLALALNLGALPTAISGQTDLSQGVPALLEAAHFISAIAGGAGGDGPYPDAIAGWGALLAALIVLLIGGALAGGLTGGAMGALGLGAAGGAVEGATIGAGEQPRGQAMAGAIKGARTGAAVGTLAALVSFHLATHFAPSREWAPLLAFDVVAAIATGILLLLCRRTWSNESGLLGNAFEAGKVIVLLLQFALGLAIVGAVLAGGLFGLKWLLS